MMDKRPTRAKSTGQQRIFLEGGRVSEVAFHSKVLFHSSKGCLSRLTNLYLRSKRPSFAATTHFFPKPNLPYPYARKKLFHYLIIFIFLIRLAPARRSPYRSSRDACASL